MARKVKPLVTKNGRVMSAVYYSYPEDSADPIIGLPAIPPERVGLNGEYDHYGLAKRVKVLLNQRFGCEVANRLNIQQRGSAILLSGKVVNGYVAERLAQAILEVDGATQVELHHLQVIELKQEMTFSAQLASVQA